MTGSQYHHPTLRSYHHLPHPLLFGISPPEPSPCPQSTFLPDRSNSEIARFEQPFCCVGQSPWPLSRHKASPTHTHCPDWLDTLAPLSAQALRVPYPDKCTLTKRRSTA